MQLKKIVNQLQLELSAFKFTDDSPLDYEYLRDALLIANKSIVDDFARTGLALDGFYQRVECVRLTCSEATCVIDGIVFNSGVYSHIASLPPLVKTIGMKNIAYLGVEGFSGEITRVSLDEFMSMEDARWNKHDAVFVVIGDVAIFKNIPKGLSLVLLITILSDCTQACDWPEDDSAEFPTPSEYKVKLIVKKDILSTFPGGPDIVDDAQMAIGQQKRQQQIPQDQQDNQQE